MPRPCTICTHDKRAEIDTAVVAGESLRGISRRFAVGPDSLERHAASHIKQEIHQSKVAREEIQGIDVVAQLKAINQISLKILQESMKDPNKHGMALKAIDRVHKQIELQAKLQGDLDERLKVDIAVQPEWIQLQKAMLQALRPYPEARVVVSEVIAQLE